MSESSGGAPNVLAIVSLVLGVLAVLTSCICCYGFPFNIGAIICGIIGIVQINGDSTQGGKGLAFGGIGLALLSFVTAMAMVFFGVALGMVGPMLENM